jgi:hypothetical protein
MATLPAQTRRFKLRISAILCKNSSDLFLDTKCSGPISTALKSRGHYTMS